MIHYKNYSLESIEGEIWVSVKGWEDFYLVSNKGRVKSCEKYIPHWRGGKKIMKSRILKQFVRKGYLNVNLCIDYNRICGKVHRMVCEAFHLNPSNLPVTNHKDLDKLNNNSTNVEWFHSRKEHSTRLG